MNSAPLPARPVLRSGPLVPQLEELFADRIRNGDWAVGQRLPSEADLAAELGVGRSSVREAIRGLARDDLLDVRHGVGTFVARSVPTDGRVDRALRRARTLELYEVRRALETEAARLAAERARPEDLAALRGLLAERHDTRGRPAAEFVAVDLEFHAAVVAAARNSVLTALFESVRPLLVDTLTTHFGDPTYDEPGRPGTDHAHDDLVRALEAGDVDAAIAATAANLDPILDELRKGGSL